jgi:hypothetical protein
MLMFKAEDVLLKELDVSAGRMECSGWMRPCQYDAAAQGWIGNPSLVHGMGTREDGSGGIAKCRVRSSSSVLVLVLVALLASGTCVRIEVDLDLNFTRCGPPCGRARTRTIALPSLPFLMLDIF